MKEAVEQKWYQTFARKWESPKSVTLAAFMTPLLSVSTRIFRAVQSHHATNWL